MTDDIATDEHVRDELAIGRRSEGKYAALVDEAAANYPDIPMDELSELDSDALETMLARAGQQWWIAFETPDGETGVFDGRYFESEQARNRELSKRIGELKRDELPNIIDLYPGELST